MEKIPQYQTAKELGAMLGIHERMIRCLARRRAIPATRLGHRTLRFEVEKVKAALARLEIKEVGRPK